MGTWEDIGMQASKERSNDEYFEKLEDVRVES